MISEILIEDMTFFAYHGFYPEERKIGCKYSVSLRITVPLAKPGTTDDLNHTVNYENVYRLVHEVMTTPSRLIEHVTQRIMDTLMQHYPMIEHLDVTLYKYNPPLGGQVNRVGIHMYR